MKRILAPAIFLLALPLQTLAADSRLPYGPDTCKSGYVWREAWKDDHACVSPAERARVAQDNAAAAARVQPGGGAYGPDTCRDGWVWRGARPQDHVCVTTQERAQAAQDNKFAYSRQQARLLEPHARPPRPREPVHAVGGGGGPLGHESDIAGCRLSGARCPKRMKVAYDDNVGCVCQE